MIKFYKDNYSSLASLSSNANAICFATDRNVILLGGKEFGKDQVQVVDSVSEIASAAGTVDAGTLYFVTGEQAVYKKTSGTPGYTVVLSSVTAAVDALEAKLSTAYANGKVVLGNGDTGITSSVFTPDTSAGDLTLTGDNLSTILVNAATLSAQIAAVNSNAAYLVQSSGITAESGTPTADGTPWTVNVRLGDSISSSLKFDSTSALVDDLKIEKISTTTGFAASYALKNGKGTQLGETINIVKDQFLSSATLVYGTEDGEGHVTEVAAADATAATNRYLKLVFDVNTDGTVNTEAQNIVYINVNELFDSYTSGNGITVDNSTNTIAVNVDTATEKDGSNNAYLTVSSDGLKVSGINAAISTAIQGLSTTTTNGDEYVTAVGVKADGTLSAATATISAGQVAFNPEGIDSLTATTVQGAIAELAADLGAGIDSLDVENTGDTTTYIQSISETDGKISAVSATLDASKVAYAATFEGTTVANVSAALDNIHTVISGMDYAQTAAGTAPSDGQTNALKFVNTIGEVDGKISATLEDLTAAKVEADGITAVTTGTETDGSDVRVGIEAGSQAHVNDQFSNLIADYCSFHDHTGAVI